MVVVEVVGVQAGAHAAPAILVMISLLEASYDAATKRLLP
jgi:hypothetical protein